MATRNNNHETNALNEAGRMSYDPVVIRQGSSMTRWLAAGKNSLGGLRYGWQHEAAIREEIIVLVITIPLASLLADSLWQGMLLVLSVLFVLIVEVLNSAIEATLDRMSTEQHPLTGAAKDLGSLAVLLAMIFAVATWLSVLLG